MKYGSILTLVLSMCFCTCLLVFPNGGAYGVIDGIKICYSVIIPSLFPFTVFTLLLFESDAIDFLTKILNPISSRLFCVNGKIFAVYIMSVIGGYPVGAKLISKMLKSNEISTAQARILLGSCVNSAPSYLIVAIGCGIFKNKAIGIVLYAACISTSLIILAITGRFIESKNIIYNKSSRTMSFSDNFVASTYDSTVSMINICSFIILFSAILGLAKEVLPQNNITDLLLSLLEITNGVSHANGNVLFVAFMSGFAGVCVHLQIFSLCSNVKPSYIQFLLFRITHGILSVVMTYILLKLFHITVQTVSFNADTVIYASKYSISFGIILVICAVVFIASIQNLKKGGNL